MLKYGILYSYLGWMEETKNTKRIRLKDKTIFILRLIKPILSLPVLSVLTIYLYKIIYLEIMVARTSLLTYIFFMMPLKKEGLFLTLVGISIWSFLMLYFKKTILEVMQQEPVHINFSTYIKVLQLFIVSFLLFVFSALIIDYATSLANIFITKYPETITTELLLHMSLIKLLWLVLFSILWIYNWLYFKKLEKIFLK